MWHLSPRTSSGYGNRPGLMGDLLAGPAGSPPGRTGFPTDTRPEPRGPS
jgi:hypothetical protein